MTSRLGLVVAASAMVLAGCGAVNADAGKPVGNAYQLLQYPGGPGTHGPEPTVGSPYGSYPVAVAGSVSYLDETTSLPGTGVLTIGPGAREDELRIAQFYGEDRFPYESTVVSAKDAASTLDGITIVNPLDSRVSVQCVLDGGIALEELDEPRELTGNCGGGATVRGTARPDGVRQASWRGDPVELVRTVVDIEISGVSNGTIRQVTETPKGGTFPLYTALDTELTAQGIHMAQELERYVLPRIED